MPNFEKAVRGPIFGPLGGFWGVFGTPSGGSGGVLVGVGGYMEKFSEIARRRRKFCKMKHIFYRFSSNLWSDITEKFIQNSPPQAKIFQNQAVFGKFSQNFCLGGRGGMGGSLATKRILSWIRIIS